MADFPAHASPGLPPLASPGPNDHQHFRLHHDPARQDLHSQNGAAPPLVTPHITPPLTPNGEHVDIPAGAQASAKAAHDAATETSAPKLLETLPEVKCEVRARIPTTTGQEMFLHLYHNNVDNKEHLAIVFGPHIRSRSLDAPRPGETERDRMIRGAYTGTLFPGRTSSRRVQELRREAGVEPVADITSKHEGEEHEEEVKRKLGPALVRIHSECYTGETVWSARCDCGEQLDEAARLMSGLCTDPSAEEQPPHADHPSLAQPSLGGVIIYLRQEGRGIGLLSKLKAYNLQDLGADTMQANLLLRHPADARSYGLATAMLLDLGLGGDKGVRLLTNNPEKVRAVEGPGHEVSVVERVPMIPIAWRTGGKEGIKSKEVEMYISTKIEKFKHMFSE
ncbi:GTP cyclohydrolase II [Myriangium duriaei CBS 260.36]|uniref:GTP cyclohydrolase II n=1 Tax=Myriangium duriaei CBS 260.36 TaxID=1168546 RepID=A0A9P4J636_9PEZI|nr:GTP cyclohydrolase II [Myriangium duriaei CBS 260.36]